MTIASEITRLQWAKADIKTSIENKGVPIPSNAKLDTYSTYVDQISTNCVFTDSLQLAWYVVSTTSNTPRIAWFVSWDDNNTFYWAFISEVTASSVHELYLVWAKKVTWNDMQYYKNQKVTISKNNYFTPEWAQFYKKDWALRAFFFCESSVSPYWNYWYQADWNLLTNQVTMQYVWRNESDTQLPSGADTTWYTQITTNSWIKSIDWYNHSNYYFIWITTK